MPPKTKKAKAVTKRVSRARPKVVFSPNWDALRDAVAPYVPAAIAAMNTANAIRCPKCSRPQDEATVIYRMDLPPEIKCECGYAGSARPEEDAGIKARLEVQGKLHGMLAELLGKFLRREPPA